MIIPTLGDRPDLLEATLQSLADQGPGILAVAVVCPKKAEDSRKLAKRFGAGIIDDPVNARGISAAVNEGMTALQPWHKYLAWMGDDDLLEPRTLAKSVAALDANPDAVASFGYCNYIDTAGKTLFTSRAGKLAPWLMTWGPDLVPLPGALFRMSAVEKVGAFDQSLKFAMDLDMFLRLRKQGSFINMQRVVGSFRWHPTSTTVANRAASLAESEFVKRRYISPSLRAVAPFWEYPVRFATHLAARRVNKLARE